MTTEWITTTEAAHLLGYESVDYFIRNILEYVVHRNIGKPGAKRPTYRVSRADVERMVDGQVRRPA